MNRIEFVGNAIFIPFFLIGVGMLIDFRVFFADWSAIYTAVVMTVVALVTKYIAAYVTQKSFGYTTNERSLIFGLSGAHAAATLAVVLVGYNIILGYDDAGAPIRLLDSAVLNATIVIIFVTCSVASIAAQRGAYKISLDESIDLDGSNNANVEESRILLPLNSLNGIKEMMNLTHFLLPTKGVVTVAGIISDTKDEATQVSRTKRIFDQAMRSASASDRTIETLLRYDVSYSNGVTNIIRENNVSDLVINIDTTRQFSSSIISKIIGGSVHNSSVTTFMYRACQPIATIKRHIIVVPPHAELELGFKAWVVRLWTMLRATGATAVIYATKETFKVLQKINETVGLPLQVNEYVRYRDLLIIARDLRGDDGLIFVLSREFNPSYDDSMENIPHYLNNYFSGHNFMLIYPYQTSSVNGDLEGMTNEASISAVAKIEEVIDSVIGVVKKRE